MPPDRRVQKIPTNSTTGWLARSAPRNFGWWPINKTGRLQIQIKIYLGCRPIRLTVKPRGGDDDVRGVRWPWSIPRIHSRSVGACWRLGSVVRSFASPLVRVSSRFSQRSASLEPRAASRFGCPPSKGRAIVNGRRPGGSSRRHPGPGTRRIDIREVGSRGCCCPLLPGNTWTARVLRDRRDSGFSLPVLEPSSEPVPFDFRNSRSGRRKAPVPSE